VVDNATDISEQTEGLSQAGDLTAVPRKSVETAVQRKSVERELATDAEAVGIERRLPARSNRGQWNDSRNQDVALNSVGPTLSDSDAVGEAGPNASDTASPTKLLKGARTVSWEPIVNLTELNQGVVSLYPGNSEAVPECREDVVTYNPEIC